MGPVVGNKDGTIKSHLVMSHSKLEASEKLKPGYCVINTCGEVAICRERTKEKLHRTVNGGF